MFMFIILVLLLLFSRRATKLPFSHLFSRELNLRKWNGHISQDFNFATHFAKIFTLKGTKFRKEIKNTDLHYQTVTSTELIFPNNSFQWHWTREHDTVCLHLQLIKVIVNFFKGILEWKSRHIVNTPIVSFLPTFGNIALSLTPSQVYSILCGWFLRKPFYVGLLFHDFLTTSKIAKIQR